jgi:hypothetical protein
MRTDDEILARIKKISPDDWLGTQQNDLVTALSWHAVQPFLTDEGRLIGPENWDDTHVHTDEQVRNQIRDYLPFAIDKALNHRGISAGRSIDHFRSWVWLLGDAPYSAIDWDNYAQYGAPILKQVSELVEFPWPTSDAPDDRLLNRMANGLPCIPDCEEGCE